MHSQSQMVHWHNFQVHWDQNGSTPCQRSRPPGHVIFCSLGIQWKKIELSIDLSAVVISRRPAVGAPAALVIATRVKIQKWLCPLRIYTMVYHQLMAILVWKMMINHNMYGMVFPFSQTQIFAAHGLGMGHPTARRQQGFQLAIYPSSLCLGENGSDWVWKPPILTHNTNDFSPMASDPGSQQFHGLQGRWRPKSRPIRKLRWNSHGPGYQPWDTLINDGIKIITFQIIRFDA